MSWQEALWRWYGVLALVTWAFVPAVRWLCQGLADRGATLARPLALLLTVYPAWLIASSGLSAFDSSVIVVTVLLVGVAGWLVLVKSVGLDLGWVRSLVSVELASLIAFSVYVWLRGYTPQILGTEKPMDVAFLASSARTLTMPPPDPWFAGEPINYYYFGYLLNGTIARLSSVAPETAFNLALATVFSATIVATFGVVWNVVRPFQGARAAAASGLFAAFALALAGNLYTPLRLLQDAPATVAAWWWDGVAGIGWRSSRIVCDGPRVGNLCQFPATETINEFPFFSFLLGDLHPHVMALPFTLVAVGLAWNLSLGIGSARGPLGFSMAGKVGASGGIIGALYALNAWDLPTYLLLACLGALIGAGTGLGSRWKTVAILLASALAAWLPYWVVYVPPSRNDAAAIPEVISGIPVLPGIISTLGLHLGERTSVAEYLTIFGVPYVVGVALVTKSFIERRRTVPDGHPITLMVTAGLFLIPGVLLSAPVIPLCGIPLLLSIDCLRRSSVVSPRGVALTLFSFAWSISVLVEIVYLRDAFDDRMNTLFKFYYQTWTLYAVASAVALAVFWSAANRPLARFAVAGCAAVAIFSGAAYPAVASYQWTDGFAVWRGLEGMAFAQTKEGDEVAAIRWLEQNAGAQDRVLEAAGCSYHPFDRLPFNRVSAFTGLPTIIGWDGHERQWRAGEPQFISEIGSRQDEVAAMFGDPQSRLFDQYSVDWLFVGSYEAGSWQAECPGAGPYSGLKTSGYPGPGWSEDFRSGSTVIYRRDETVK